MAQALREVVRNHFREKLATGTDASMLMEAGTERAKFVAGLNDTS